jgi:nucleoside kinase
MVVGHTNIDRFLEVAELPQRDRTVPVLDGHDALGGTAATIALSAARYGVRTALVSLVGEDFPAGFRSRLASARVELSALTPVPGARTPTCYVLEDGRGSQMTVIDQGAMADASRAKVPTDLLERTRWVHLTTGDPTYQLKVLEAARELGRPVAADPAQEVHYRWRARDLATLVDGAEILFGNEAEIATVVRKLELARPQELLERVPLVVITRGPSGATALTRVGTHTIAAGKPVAARRVTGAGDAFRGGFYAGWFSGQPLVACLRAGIRSARGWLLAAQPGRGIAPVGGRRR